jgi:glycosyltransferase involved in cell wall biosynthesis
VLADLGGLSYILSEIGGYPIGMGANVSKQIATAIKTVFSNDVEKDIEKQRHKVLQDYSWTNITKQLITVYEGALTR